MSNFIDLSGQRFGKLTVIKRSSKIGEPIKFLCQCDCGNQKEIRGGDLRSGRTLSCGCLRKETNSKNNTKNLINQKFGKLTVIAQTDKRYNRSIIWKCKCDCGNIIEVPTGRLTSGNTKSCGCLQKEAASEANSADLINQRFGKLIVLKKTDIRKNKNVIWECLCDCGNIHYVPSNLLLNGKVKSCGCLSSYGEETISKILKENEVPFETQKTFSTCVFPNSKAKAKFDFYVNNQYIIEYDGKQHFEIIDFFGGEEEFKKQRERDLIKNKYCFDHNIPLIRIPYNAEYTLDDLKLETTRFLLTPDNEQEYYSV